MVGKDGESTSPKTYLQATFQEETAIKGIIINSEEGSRKLENARVWVDQKDKIELQDYFKATDDHKEQYIIFKESVTTSTIQLDSMASKKSLSCFTY